jgi:hypothetical protein
MRSKTHRKAPFQRSWKSEKHRTESFLKDLLITLTEASYQLAVKCGFQGSFIHFLSDFQETVEKVIEQQKPVVLLRKEQRHRAEHQQESENFFKGWGQYE